MSTRWSTTTKLWILTASTILIAFTLYRLRSLLPLVGLAAVLAYVLNPLVDRLSKHSPLGRTAATALIYVSLLALLLVMPALSAPSLLEQARAIDRALIQDIIENLIRRIQAYSQDSTVRILGFIIDMRPVYDQIITSLQRMSTSVASQSLNFLLNFATGFASTLLGVFLTLVMSFYMVKDAHTIVAYVEDLVPSAYRQEAIDVVGEINQVWRAFFRGQIILCIVVGFVTWLGLLILGVPNALLLGILAGILELIPNLGPTLAAIPAVLIALFQGSTHFGISPGWFAVMVVVLYVGIQQVENTVLVPRILGSSVHLHPVVVLIGVLAGASVAGILGIFLAAPTIASIRVLGSYAYRKLLEPPAAEPMTIAEEPPAAEREVEPVPTAGLSPREAEPASEPSVSHSPGRDTLQAPTRCNPRQRLDV